MLKDAPVRRIVWSIHGAHPAHDDAEHATDPRTREWLVTNGLGGYASGTIAGAITRRFHGLLVAALPAPLGRTMMLNHLSEEVRSSDGRAVALGPDTLVEFRLEAGLPVWEHEAFGVTIEKRLILRHGQNTSQVSFRALGAPAAGSLRVRLEPWVNFRPHEGSLDRPLAGPYALTIVDDRFELSSPAGFPPLRMQATGPRAAFTIEGERRWEVHYRIEKSRGYDAAGELYTPGAFSVALEPHADATFVASTETWETLHALTPAEAEAAERERRRRLLLAADPHPRADLAAELVLAADPFLITPAGRVEDAARARAGGDEVRTVIAGYHWFTDWGRDTMISLEGLTLATGRRAEAGWILRTFAHYVRDGLIPNMFPEGNNSGLYHTADATLWFFHAIDRYLDATGDRETLRTILPQLLSIAEHHLRGTRFGISVDPADGLLRQGQEGYQLTWMDAKVGGLVVTPRRGKAVEINALYHNALCLLARWLGEEGDAEAARAYADHAARARASFNRRFWYAPGGHLYDVIDGEGGDDPSFRPNQILAISLPSPILDPSRWAPVVAAVKDRLLTPVGLRSLAPGHPDYKPRYFGDLRARDLAYHQGTVWAWLIGPFVDAWLKVHPDDRAGARRFLAAFEAHLDEACAGSISEIFDAEEPFTPRGCVAQAWSVAEVLRAWVKTAGG